MKYFLLSTMGFLSIHAWAEEIRIPVNEANFKCHMESYPSHGEDGRYSETIYWAFAQYEGSDHLFETSLGGGVDFDQISSHCSIVNDILQEAQGNDGFINVISEETTYQRRSQEMEGGVWAPMPSCRYVIYTITQRWLAFPGNLTLFNTTHTSQTFDDECP